MDVEKRIQQLQDEIERLNREKVSVVESRDELAEIFSLSLDLLCIADINTTFFKKVNPAFIAKLGYSEKELLSRSFLDFIHPDDVDDTRAMVEKKLKAGENVINFTNRYRCADGTYLWLEWVSNPRPERGVTFAVAHDITQRQLTEKKLRENQIFIHTVMDNLPLGIAVNSVDPTVNFEYMNDNFPTFYRTTRRALMADPDRFWDAVYEDPEFRQQIKKRVLDDCALGDPERMFWEDIPITRKGRPVRYVSAKNTPIPEKGLMVSTVWDVTARKQAEADRQKLQAQLSQRQKMESVGRLAGGVAHDFNNMLGVILGNAELALDLLPKDHPVQANLEEILDAARRSAKLTQQLLAFARKQTVAPKVIKVNAVVAGMLDMLRRLIGEHIVLNWMPRSGLWPVKIDPSQIDQILANLCVNARDAITGNGQITIETSNVTFDKEAVGIEQKIHSGDYVLIEVADNGGGMDEAVSRYLFDPFFTTKAQGEGTGLGLATVYGIVKQNRGIITVNSQPGTGTVFGIYLPRYLGSDAVANEAEKDDALPPGHARKTVLIVEDESPNLHVCKTMLEKMNCKVLAAMSPSEAIELAKAHAEPIDLVITDVIMPEMNGKELVQRLLAVDPGIKRLFMSGYTSNVIAHHGVLEEGVNFIQKPFSFKELAAKVRAVLEQ